jgi:hypothetical protein
LDPIDTGLFAAPSGWYPFAPTSQLHETLKALPSDPIQTTTRGRPDPSLLFGLRRVLDPKPTCPLNLGRIRHRSESPAQADGYHFIVIDPALLGIGQKVTSISHAGVHRAPARAMVDEDPLVSMVIRRPHLPGWRGGIPTWTAVGGHHGRPWELGGPKLRRRRRRSGRPETAPAVELWPAPERRSPSD